jgi:hypothetical protein
MSKNKFETITLNSPDISDFAYERNKLLETSHCDWVFFLDIDEVMSKELEKEINETIQNSDCNGYYVLRKNIFLNNLIGQDNVLRLGRKSKGKWKRGVHEYWHIKGKTGKLKNPLIHNTAESLFLYINKINKYSRLHALENIKEGKTSGLIKIMFYPLAQFIKSLINKRGVVFSIMQALHSFMAWSIVYQLRKNEK